MTTQLIDLGPAGGVDNVFTGGTAVGSTPAK